MSHLSTSLVLTGSGASLWFGCGCRGMGGGWAGGPLWRAVLGSNTHRPATCCGQSMHLLLLVTSIFGRHCKQCVQYIINSSKHCHEKRLSMYKSCLVVKSGEISRLQFTNICQSSTYYVSYGKILL